MLRLAFGYLAIAVVVAIGFGSLSETGPSERQVAAKRETARPAAERSVVHEPDEPRDHWLPPANPDDNDDFLNYVVEPGPGGHYLVDAVVNGTPVRFLVDTGASDVVLTMEDAERLGLDPRTLRFTQRFATANGEVRGAPVVLRELRIGQFSLFDLPASVNEGPLSISLLGMSFLGRLSGYQVENGRLILHW